MRVLGRWEWFGLAVLVIAVGIGVMFLDAGAGQPAAPEREAATPAPRADAKDDGPPGQALPGEPTWIFSFYDLSSGERVLRDRGTGSELDFAWDGVPFPDYGPGAWVFVAEWGFEAPPGRYGVALDFQGEIRIHINGSEVLHLRSPAGSGSARSGFLHPGGAGTLRIELFARDNPVSLTWRELLDGDPAVDVE